LPVADPEPEPEPYRCTVCFGDASVTWQTTHFTKYKFYTMENLGTPSLTCLRRTCPHGLLLMVSRRFSSRRRDGGGPQAHRRSRGHPQPHDGHAAHAGHVRSARHQRQVESRQTGAAPPILCTTATPAASVSAEKGYHQIEDCSPCAASCHRMPLRFRLPLLRRPDQPSPADPWRSGVYGGG